MSAETFPSSTPAPSSRPAPSSNSAPPQDKTQAAGASAPGGATCGVGVIGLGTMGAPMAGHMLAAGLDVHVHARRPAASAALAEAGATAHPTAAALAARCSVVVLVVPDLPDVEALLGGPDGLLAVVDHPLVIVISSTVSPEGVRQLGARLDAETRGLVQVVDAPISGGERGAIAGTLAIMVGGRDHDVALAWPALQACGNPAHLGPIGAGQVAKACNQMIVAATVLALSEASIVAERAGLDVQALFDLLGTGLAGSQVLEQKKHALVTHEHPPSGPAKFMVKDLRFATAEARAGGTVTPQLDVLSEVFIALTEAGLGEQDVAVVQTYVQNLRLP
ncbi:NAD(P)-dependent oxidoreductase [Demequina aurantiaca]|uniref:NAD(P)-dependent oxidoreductase n=1 Tax=Demequina aurantiaca TaxID=676200 RepID=UPI003D34D574